MILKHNLLVPQRALHKPYTSSIIWWQNLQSMHVVSSCDQICKQCKWHHLVANFATKGKWRHLVAEFDSCHGVNFLGPLCFFIETPWDTDLHFFGHFDTAVTFCLPPPTIKVSDLDPGFCVESVCGTKPSSPWLHCAGTKHLAHLSGKKLIHCKVFTQHILCPHHCIVHYNVVTWWTVSQSAVHICTSAHLPHTLAREELNCGPQWCTQSGADASHALSFTAQHSKTQHSTACITCT